MGRIRLRYLSGMPGTSGGKGWRVYSGSGGSVVVGFVGLASIMSLVVVVDD